MLAVISRLRGVATSSASSHLEFNKNVFMTLDRVLPTVVPAGLSVIIVECATSREKMQEYRLSQSVPLTLTKESTDELSGLQRGLRHLMNYNYEFRRIYTEHGPDALSAGCMYYIHNHTKPSLFAGIKMHRKPTALYSLRINLSTIVGLPSWPFFINTLAVLRAEAISNLKIWQPKTKNIGYFQSDEPSAILTALNLLGTKFSLLPCALKVTTGPAQCRLFEATTSFGFSRSADQPTFACYALKQVADMIPLLERLGQGQPNTPRSVYLPGTPRVIRELNSQSDCF
jgi:hypothetical protein